MNKIVLVSIILAILGAAGVAIYYATRKRETGVPSTGCVKVDHEKWGYWNEDDRASGLLRSLAEKYFPDADDHGMMGSIVGGWFKAVNAYPNAAMARAYEAELLAWASSHNASPWWLVSVGEMECKT